MGDGEITSPKLAEAFLKGKRQNNTSDTEFSDCRIEIGWGSISGNTSQPEVTETVTFNEPFDSLPIVWVSMAGENSSNGMSYNNTSGSRLVRAGASNITESNFVASLARTDGSNFLSRHYYYTWLAIGPA